jgi:hypothetical protein
MWGALARQLFAYVLTRRGKKVLAFVGTMLLCFVTALLLDLKLYLTAGFTGLLTLVTLIAWLVQGFKQRRGDRLRERQDAEDAVRRAAAAQARGETIGKAKSTVAGAVGVAKSGLAGARDTITLRRWRRSAGPPPQEPPQEQQSDKAM